MNGGSDWPEEEGEDVARFVRGNNDRCTEVLHLKQKEREKKNIYIISISVHITLHNQSNLILMTVNLKHSFGLFGKGHIVYPDCKAEGICEEDGSVHWVDRTVPDVEQCCCVVKAQVTARRDDQPEKL